MRALLIVLSVTVAAIVTLVPNLPLVAQDDAVRWVEVTGTLAPGADTGFQPVETRRLADDLVQVRGRLPQSKIDLVRDLPGVKSVSVGPVVAKSPTPVKSFAAGIRFFIEANRQQRYAYYQEMTKKLDELGFKKDKGIEGDEFYSNTMAGTVPGANAYRLLSVPYVQTVLLIPEGYQPPMDMDKPVMVQIELTTRYGPTRLRALRTVTRDLLGQIGFQEAVGYDHHEFSRMLGWMPFGKLEAIVQQNLLIDMPTPPNRDPLTVPGPIVVGVTVHYTLDVRRDDLLKGLQARGFEQVGGDADKGGRDTVIGRVPLRTLPDLKRVEGVAKVDVDPETARERVAPIRLVEVLREPEGEKVSAPVTAALPKEATGQDKISADLRKQLAETQTNEPIRVEVLLRTVPTADDTGWQNTLSVGGIAIEGRIGPLVSGWSSPSQIRSLAELDEVSTVRLPQPARQFILPPLDPKDPAKLPVIYVPLGREPVEPQSLAALIRRRAPLRAGVIGSDFSGYQNFIGKGLPANTTFIDLTPERSTEIQPEPMGDTNQVGAGTRLALALAAAAPHDELYLLRIDAAAPYQVEEIARSVSGIGWRSQALITRDIELQRRAGQLDTLRTELRVERSIVMNNFNDDEDSKKVRQEYVQKQKAFDEALKAHDQKVTRYLQFVAETKKLKNLGTVLLGLAWPDGQPALPGDTPGLRFIDRNLLRTASWIQALQPQPASTWTGVFRDADNDGAMEFSVAAPTADRPDLNFLAWQPFPWQANAVPNGDKVSYQELPANSTVQLTLQWREVHSPTWKDSVGADHYRVPLAPLRVVVLRQRDPAGQVQPSDAFDVIERSTGVPDRIENDRRSAVYQITVRFRVPEKPGRYAVRIEGFKPETTLPGAAQNVPHPERWELQPKLTAEIVDPATRAKGRLLLQN